MFSRLIHFLFKRGQNEQASDAGMAEETTAHPPGDESASETPAAISAEELCQLKDGMTYDELRAHLAKLYRRHNRAAASLDPKLRDEAERMLDAIVEIRHRYLEEES